MTGNYRSLRFECKCTVLSSNFLIKTKADNKNIILNYELVSLGYLFRVIL